MKKPVEERQYYVYVYYTANTHEPFYVGKGTAERWKKTTHRGAYFERKLKKNGGIVEIVFDNLTEIEAYEAEVWLIYEYKHILNHDLVNLTDGGDDPPTLFGSKHPRSRSVTLVNTGEVFSTVAEAKRKAGVTSGVTACAKQRVRYAGVAPNGEAMIWRYTDEYDPTEKFDFTVINPVAVPRKVRCVTTGDIFESAAKAEEVYNVSRKQIFKVCSGKRKTTGTLPDGTKLEWEYI